MNEIELSERTKLSICVPTFNGGARLPTTLKYLSNALNKKLGVEVLIVDNCSVDNTFEVVKLYLQDKRWRYIKNPINLGYNFSVINAIQNLARGEFMWIIGDDDWVAEKSIDFVLQYLTDDIDFISLTHTMCHTYEAVKSVISQNHIKYIYGKYEEALENTVQSSNLLGTFMSATIFRLDKVKVFDFSVFNQNSWTDYKSVFPIGFIMAHSFNNSQGICVSSSLIACMPHTKSWDNQLRMIDICYLPDMLSDFTERLNMKLPKSKKLIQYNKIISIICSKKIKYYKYLSLEDYFYLFYPSLILRILKKYWS